MASQRSPRSYGSASAHSEGIHAGRDVFVGGNVDASANVHSHNETVTPATSELTAKIDALMDELQATGLWRDPAVGRAAAELTDEMDQPTVDPTRIGKLLDTIAANAKNVASVIGAIEAAKLLLGL